MAFLLIEKGCPVICGRVDEDERFTCTSVVEEVVQLKSSPDLFSSWLLFYNQWFLVREDDCLSNMSFRLYRPIHESCAAFEQYQTAVLF